MHVITCNVPHRRSFQTRRHRLSRHTCSLASSLEPSSTGSQRSYYTYDETVCACSLTLEALVSSLPRLIHESGLRPTAQGQSLRRPPCHPSHRVPAAHDSIKPHKHIYCVVYYISSEFVDSRHASSTDVKDAFTYNRTPVHVTSLFSW